MEMSKFLKTCLLLAFSGANLLYMHYYFIYCNLYVDADKMFLYAPFINILSVITDVSVVFLVWLCITWGRIRLSVHLCFGTTLLWSFSNVFYSRFFYQCLTLTSIQQTTNIFDGVVINSILYGFEWSDFYYILNFTLYVYAYKRTQRYNRVFVMGKKALACILFIPFLSFASSFLIYTLYFFTSPHYKHHPNLFLPGVNENLINPFVWKNSMPCNVLYQSGSIRFLLSDIKDEFATYELSTEDKNRIKREYMDHNLRSTSHSSNPQIKNVVFILLESFLSVSSNLKVQGKEITPFLNSLRNDSTVYYNGKIMSNITLGESGDGQLIYMSGLLPLRNRVTVGIAKHTNLKGLPQVLKDKYGVKYTEIIIPSSPVIWEQRYMNERYGIDFMISATDVEGTSAFLIDEETIFSLAKGTGKERKQPFFSMVLSVSTHQPYNNSVDNNFSLDDKNYPTQFLNYLIACHYVDQQIRDYFSFLQQKGIYENSLIIIASDHQPHINQLHMEGRIKQELPLYIINSGIDVKTMYQGKANQLDIYTTILDVLGINNEWLGLGHTLLTSSYINSVDNNKYDLSEMIIMGDYFEKTH